MPHEAVHVTAQSAEVIVLKKTTKTNRQLLGNEKEMPTYKENQHYSGLTYDEAPELNIMPISCHCTSKVRKHA